MAGEQMRALKRAASMVEWIVVALAWALFAVCAFIIGLGILAFVASILVWLVSG